MLEELNEPLMSTSLILGNNELAESDPETIREQLEKRVDLIVDGLDTFLDGLVARILEVLRRFVVALDHRGDC